MTPPEIAAKLTPEQEDALFAAATVLDAVAGAGIGVQIEMESGAFSTVFADDIVMELCRVFGLTMPDTANAFGLAVRAELEKSNGE